MVGKPILDSQRKPIEAGIVRIPYARIHVMHGENYFFPEPLVVKHQQRSIEGLEFIVPQDVKDSWLRFCSVANQPGVVRLEPWKVFLRKPTSEPLIASQIKKAHSGLAAKFRAIQFVATNHVQCRAL